jgi:hypothetical protein
MTAQFSWLGTGTSIKVWRYEISRYLIELFHSTKMQPYFCLFYYRDVQTEFVFTYFKIFNLKSHFGCKIQWKNGRKRKSILVL